jgi:DNA-directed RNA polymerase specialized sigma24 family protein
MHELDSIPVPDIAKTLGISAITVRWHLAVGRRELARALKPFTGENHDKH